MPIEGSDTKDIKGFLGVNIRIDSVDLAESEEGVIEMRKAVNVDKHTTPQVILLRKGREEQFSSALADLVIRRLGKFNNVRYQVAGVNLYRTQVDVNDYRTKDFDSDRLHTTLVSFKPLNDTAIWTFVADRGTMLKDDGTNTFRWGLPLPPLFEVAQESSATYTYKIGVTHIRFDGVTLAHESNPLTVTITETL